jgi:hypothetical protein
VAVREEIGGDPHRGARREDVVPAGDVLLEDVVLNRAPQLVTCDALLLADELIEEQEQRGGGVDRHRRRDLAERDIGEEELHVRQ